VAAEPDLADAWRGLAEAFELIGDEAAAQAARARQIKGGVRDPVLMSAAAALVDGKPGEAEKILRGLLETRPDEPAAIRMLAEAVARLGRQEEAATLLADCLKIAPAFTAARHNLATLHYRLGGPRRPWPSWTACWPTSRATRPT
jgi:predicted Zn-dependent protease